MILNGGDCRSHGEAVDVIGIGGVFHLVQVFDQKASIADRCRVTIGSREQMDIFLKKVREILKEVD